MTESGVQKWYSSQYDRKYGNYESLMTTFYGCGVFQKSESELVEWFDHLERNRKLTDCWEFRISVQSCGGRTFWTPAHNLDYLIQYLLAEEPTDIIKKFLVWISEFSNEKELTNWTMLIINAKYKLLKDSSCFHIFDNGKCKLCKTHSLCEDCYQQPWKTYCSNEDCDRNLCCSKECNTCGREYCTKCSDILKKCGDHYSCCEFEKCGGCQTKKCGQCLEVCNNCEKVFCEKCVSELVRCDDYFHCKSCD